MDTEISESVVERTRWIIRLLSPSKKSLALFPGRIGARPIQDRSAELGELSAGSLLNPGGRISPQIIFLFQSARQ
jgi:hypothetical protein